MSKTKILTPLDDHEFDENSDVERNYANIFEVLSEIKIGKTDKLTFEGFFPN